LEPLIKGSGGVEYLQKSFAGRCGSPSDALASLPSTARWIFSLKDVVEEQWNEHVSSLSILPEADHVSSSFGLVFFSFLFSKESCALLH
jgi:hypothetical protein